MRIAACGFDSARRGYIIKSVKDRAGGKRRPDRRLHSRDPSPLLIYHDRQIIATVQGTQCISQSAKLLPVLDVSLEQDIASRFSLTKKRTLVVGERRARKTKNNRLHECFTSLLRHRHAVLTSHRSEEHTSELKSLMRISYAV